MNSQVVKISTTHRQGKENAYFNQIIIYVQYTFYAHGSVLV